jgi:hypothetical protein
LSGLLVAASILNGVFLIVLQNSNHGQVSTMNLQLTEAALFALPFEDLLSKAQLIVLGNVLDQKPTRAGSNSSGLVNHTISIEEVIKGCPLEILKL